MSGITSGVGLASGLPTAELIDALMAAAERPKTLLENRVTELQTQQSAILDLNARILSIVSSISQFGKSSFFNQFSANSSNESILTAIASESASPGVINMTVKSLVTSHQLISSGFPDADSTPVGAGLLTVEMGNGNIVNPTSLGDLNGGAGVRRGIISITDGDGNSAEIDLTAALDVQEVLEQINTAGEINVHASVSGNHIVLQDLSGGTGKLVVHDLNGGFAAQDLGISGAGSEGTLEGQDIIYLDDSTLLSTLNDGNGIRRNSYGDDFSISTNGASFNVSLIGTIDDQTSLDVLNNGNGVRLGTIKITNRMGVSGTVDLSSATTIGDVKGLIAAAVDENGQSLGVKVDTLSISGSGALSVVDSNDPPEGNEHDLVIQDVDGYAAGDLGIAQQTDSASFVGDKIHRITTIGDVVRAINYAEGNNGMVRASLTTNGIRIEDLSGGGPESLVIEAIGDDSPSMAAFDLGIEGVFDGINPEVDSRDLLAGLNTVLLSSLNGGSGLETGVISITTMDGTGPVEVDLTGARTVQDLVNIINNTVSGVKASVNAVGTGIEITDTTGGNTGSLAIADVTGTLAADLGIVGTADGKTASGSNLQLQYINELTKLDELNGESGIRTGEIQFQTSTAEIFNVDIDDSYETVGDVIDAINTAGSEYGITASINETGDGILISDSSGGEGTLTITDIGAGMAAADLRIAGEAPLGKTEIDGSYEIRINVDAGDTLQDVAAKIEEASSNLKASVLNDGASGSSYRLSLTSGISGSKGKLLFDPGSTGLNMNTLVAAQDAVVLIGGEGATSPIVASSSSNTLTGVLPGVDIDLVGVSDEPVTLTIGQDIESVVEDLNSFVSSYNGLIGRIDDLTAFDEETSERGVLLGDSTVITIESRLSRMMLTRFDHAQSGTQTLGSIGITFSNGELTFDESVFREKYEENPAAIEQLFTAEEVGVAALFQEVLDGLSDDENGLLSRRNETIGNQVDDLNDRIETLEDQLEYKRETLELQYANLETVISSLQSQQNALTELAALAAG